MPLEPPDHTKCGLVVLPAVAEAMAGSLARLFLN
jgi:hypothetical protein